MDLSSRINYRFSVLRKTKIRSKETEKIVFLIGNDRTVSQRHGIVMDSSLVQNKAEAIKSSRQYER